MSKVHKHIIVPLVDPYLPPAQAGNPPLIILNEDNEDYISVILGFSSEDKATAYLLPGREVGQELHIRFLARTLITDSLGESVPNNQGQLAVRCLEPNTYGQQVMFPTGAMYNHYYGFMMGGLLSNSAYVAINEFWVRPDLYDNNDFVYLKWNGKHWIILAHSEFAGWPSAL